MKDIMTCKNHSPYYGYLTLLYDYKKIHFPNNNETAWKRYKELLPYKNHDLNFDEQKTPLIKINSLGKKYGFTNLYVKMNRKIPQDRLKIKKLFAR